MNKDQIYMQSLIAMCVRRGHVREICEGDMSGQVNENEVLRPVENEAHMQLRLFKYT
jgi:hypothetical protein